jgi:hypothetical protein
VRAIRNNTRYKKGLGYFLLLLGLVVAAGWYATSVNLSLDTSLRGLNQFDRDIFDSLARSEVLLLPVAIFLRLAYADDRVARFVSAAFVVSLIVNSVSYGDRRELVYYLIGYSFIISRSNPPGLRGGMRSPIPGRLLGFFILGCVFVIASYYYRGFTGDKSAVYLGYYALLQGSFGGLGSGAILSEVKNIVENTTGLLHGQSFLTYFATLMIPSALLYLVGLDEFLFRSSFEFDRLFNQNPNMGYDFMMIADFYWNFGLAGYLVFLLVSSLVFFYVKNAERQGTVLSTGNAALITIFFVAGQRSDFGFFLKGVFICCLVFWGLHFAMKRT